MEVVCFLEIPLYSAFLQDILRIAFLFNRVISLSSYLSSFSAWKMKYVFTYLHTLQVSLCNGVNKKEGKIHETFLTRNLSVAFPNAWVFCVVKALHCHCSSSLAVC